MRYIDGRGYYTVSEVAQAAGISPQTVRVWERHLGVQGRRSPGGHRLFDQDAMQAIVEHAAKQRREAVVQPALTAAGPDTAISDRELAATGSRIRAARERVGMTQQAVATQVGVSRSLLSAIERGESGVSVTVFSRIADIVGIPMSELAPPSPGTQRLIRPDQRPRTFLGNGVTWEELATPGHTIAPAVLYAAPGASSGGGVTITRENFVTVLDGRLDFYLEVSGESVPLSAGDALLLAAGDIYRWTNTTTTIARALWIEQLRD